MALLYILYKNLFYKNHNDIYYLRNFLRLDAIIIYLVHLWFYNRYYQLRKHFQHHNLDKDIWLNLLPLLSLLQFFRNFQIYLVILLFLIDLWYLYYIFYISFRRNYFWLLFRSIGNILDEHILNIIYLDFYMIDINLNYIRFVLVGLRNHHCNHFLVQLYPFLNFVLAYYYYCYFFVPHFFWKDFEVDFVDFEGFVPDSGFVPFFAFAKHIVVDNY